MAKKVLLKDVATLLNGRAYKQDELLDSGKYPVLRVGNFFSNRGWFYSDLELEDDKYCDNGDLLFAWSASFGPKIWDGGKVIYHYHIWKILTTPQIDKKYFYYYLENAADRIKENGHGIAMIHTTKGEMEQMELQLPEMEQQLQIAAILDKVSELISLREKQLTKLDQLVKSRFVEMFGDPVQNPMEWPISALSEHINFLTSGSRGWAQYFSDNGEYFITIKNVKNCKITLDDVQYVFPPNNAEAKRTKVQEGDLLISITADLGRTGVVTKEIADYGGYINQHLTCIRLDRSAVRPLYVAYYMESDAGKEQFMSKNQSAVKAGLNFNAINSLKLMVPPIDLQDAFIAIVERTEQTKLTIQSSLDKLEVLKKSLMQEYFG